MATKKKLRHNEYYDTQSVFDKLYDDSKQGKKSKNLIELMANEENIKLAYRNIKSNPGSKTPGTDGLTIKDISKLPTESVIGKIQDMFKWYMPSSVRRVMIEKENGKLRPLGIPTIWDRLFQQCILQVLEPICEAKFYGHSYGFRPNRSTHHAIARTAYLINQSKLHHCVDIDIKGFFDNIDHGKLLKQIWTLGIREKKLISIISALLKAEIVGEGKPTKGTPQGGILSPLLSNIVLNELDWWISNQWDTFQTKKDYTNYYTRPNGKTVVHNGSKYNVMRKTKLKEIYIVRYADDFKILCRTRNQARSISHGVKQFLAKRLKLECSEEKSKVVNLKKSSSEFLGFRIKATRKRKRKKNSKEYTDLDSTVINMSNKAIDKATQKIKNAINEIHREQNVYKIHNFNSVVHGMQNYYKVASNITENLSEINFRCLRTMKRLDDYRTKASNKDFTKTQEKRYKGYSPALYKIQGMVLSPIYAQKTQNPLNFNQDICDYTAKGRSIIHKNQKVVIGKKLAAIMRSYLPNRTIEYNDNRISKFISQYGKCQITKIELSITNWHCHHIVPTQFGGDDRYSNLVILHEDIHKLIHLSDNNKIQCILSEYKISKKQLETINQLRSKAHKKPVVKEKSRRKAA
ncbi:group II intron reverse transcriptase/maturase [Priestia megaterium]|uniref:group II intron reverse transcriptase/maturase n=1 Tax=Priestia megaterium TaxID=1404 RepID=UPI002E1FBB75|nr:group II intron reverse transcriptase/maturase [Priestia megaterium]MED4284802.1 group II intron reverse transcriptase/maturase [Priestia megaterium]